MNRVVLYKKVCARYMKKVEELARKYSFDLRNAHSYCDITGTLLGGISKVESNYLISKLRKSLLSDFWTLKKYLFLIEKYPSFREGEFERCKNLDDFLCAFPDLRQEGHKVAPGTSINYYVWKSAERLKDENENSFSC